YPDDYERDQTRKYIFIALLTALYKIPENDIATNNNSEYFLIPENKVSFFDILYKNVKINTNGIEKIVNFATQYKEKVENGNIIFEPFMVSINDDSHEYFGHLSYDLNGRMFRSDLCTVPTDGVKSDFFAGDDMKFVNGLLVK
ncbi:MAG TPA: peptidase M14, partial [Flavobacterium sp.]|nr:peptidase M14 [Flavobacterium sp.]